MTEQVRYQRYTFHTTLIAGETATWKVEMVLVDTVTQGQRTENLTIETRVVGPLRDHPQALELAALERVHELLGQRIRAMLSA